MKKISLAKPPQHVRKVSTFSQKLILDLIICITFYVFLSENTPAHRKIKKTSKCPFCKKIVFSHFLKNHTIEKTDINVLKISSNWKSAKISCIKMANFAF